VEPEAVPFEVLLTCLFSGLLAAVLEIPDLILQLLLAAAVDVILAINASRVKFKIILEIRIVSSSVRESFRKTPVHRLSIAKGVPRLSI
jgi:hypothetical protein